MLKKISSLLVVLGLIILLCSKGFIRSSCSSNIIFYIPKGSNFFDIGRLLVEQKILKNPWLFYLCACIKEKRKKKYYQAGEHLIPEKSTIFTIVDILKEKPIERWITIPEGWSVRQIINDVNNHPFLEGAIESMPKEGCLFPSTYYFIKGEKRQKIIDRMSKKMIDVLNKINIENHYHILILASIIQKEAASNTEMPFISAVFHNRLKNNMLLQADPTIVYALSPDFSLSRPLSKADLKLDSPYNMYLYKGVPPTPICCPGYHAIKAAASPAHTQDLFFVKDPHGKKHQFSKNYKDHQYHVKKLRLFEKNK
jgi:UPF0755 protein